MNPRIGRIVHYHTGDLNYPVAAAIITHVWSPTCVNLSVCPDASYSDVVPGTLLSSVMLADDSNTTKVWSWPPLETS